VCVRRLWALHVRREGAHAAWSAALRGRMLQRQGFSKYNAVFEFPYEIQGQRVQMAVTSVTGHLMELDFEPSYR